MEERDSGIFTAHLYRTPKISVFLFLGIASGLVFLLVVWLLFPGLENTSPVVWISLTLLFIGFGLAIFGFLYLFLGFLFRRVYTVKVMRQHFSEPRQMTPHSDAAAGGNVGGDVCCRSIDPPKKAAVAKHSAEKCCAGGSSGDCDTTVTATRTGGCGNIGQNKSNTGDAIDTKHKPPGNGCGGAKNMGGNRCDNRGRNTQSNGGGVERGDARGNVGYIGDSGACENTSTNNSYNSDSGCGTRRNSADPRKGTSSTGHNKAGGKVVNEGAKIGITGTANNSDPSADETGRERYKNECCKAKTQ